MINKIINNPARQTNWYVITGAPCSGKTTVVNLLQAQGYKTTIENARHYLDTQRLDGRTTDEIKKNQTAFQAAVLNMQIQQENELSPGEIVFLDRAIPDALAYYRFLHLPEDKMLLDTLYTVSYKKVFILEYLPLVHDYARTEDETAQKEIHALLIDVYQSFPFPIIYVPILKPQERADLILKNL